MLEAANGKIDRARLPRSRPPQPRTKQRGATPRTPVERLVAKLWCSLLKIDAVGIDDNFFELGGDSLTAVRLVARVAQATGEAVNVRSIFENPTVRDFAAALSGDIGSEHIAREAQP